MLNFAYLYAGIWSVVLFTYVLGWSDLCTPLQPGLLVFLLTTIIMAIAIGWRFRKWFQFKKMEKCPQNYWQITAGIIAFCVFEFIFCGQIPLFSVISGAERYATFTGIKFLHPLVLTFAYAYMQYLFYVFICFPKKYYNLIQYVVLIIVVEILYYNRGGMLITVAISGLMLCAAVQSNCSRKTKIWVYVGAVLAGIAALYIFGGLGNMRHGYEWNDTSYMHMLGRFNHAYPSWLPEQFMWAYSYVITPIVNLNYSMSEHLASPSVLAFISILIPDFIRNRFFSWVYVPLPELVVPDFNATAAYGYAYMCGGIVGMYGYFAALMGGSLLVTKILRHEQEVYTPALGIISSVCVFTFFTNSIAQSSISFPLFYVIFFLLVKWITEHRACITRIRHNNRK